MLVGMGVEVVVVVDGSISVVDFTDVVAGVVDVIGIVVELLVDGANVVIVDIDAVELFVTGADVAVVGPMVVVPFVDDKDVVDFVFSIGCVVLNWLVVPLLETVLASVVTVRVGELGSVASVEDSVEVCSIVFVLMSVDVC